MPVDPSVMHLNGPIPGESLTRAPGSVPWEQPPKYTKVDDVMQFFLKSFQDKNNVHSFLATMEAGAPLDTTIYTILSHGFAEGLWTPSLMILLIQPLTHLLVAILKHSGIKYIPSYTPQKGKLDNMFALVSQKQEQAKVAAPKIKEFMQQAKSLDVPSMDSPKVQKFQKGLMAPPTSPAPGVAPQPQGATS